MLKTFGRCFYGHRYINIHRIHSCATIVLFVQTIVLFRYIFLQVQSVYDEWKSRCPVFLKFLRAACQKESATHLVPPGVMILFARNKQLSAWQYINGLLMDYSGMKDEVRLLCNGWALSKRSHWDRLIFG